MKLIFALATLLLPGLAPAATVMMRFETTVIATAFGSSAFTPLTVTYSFDSELVSGTGVGGMAGPSASSYGPLSSMEIKLGNQTISGTAGSSISVWNDSVDGDQYEVRVEPAGATVFGMELQHFRFLVVDPSGTIFSDTGLPTAFNFSSTSGFFQQTTFDLSDMTITPPLGIIEVATTPAGGRRPFTLTVIPEPGPLAICGLAVLGTAGIRRRRGLER